MMNKNSTNIIGNIKSPFRHPWWVPFKTENIEPCRPIEEWAIIEISKTIRSKPDWQLKYKNEEIVRKWKQEIGQQYKDILINYDDVINYVFEELQWYEGVETNFPNFANNGFHIGCDDKICFSDQLIPSQIRQDLAMEVEKFAEIEFHGQWDYHPGSNNQVIDIVHPSLYPLQYGKTVEIPGMSQKVTTIQELKKFFSENRIETSQDKSDNVEDQIPNYTKISICSFDESIGDPKYKAVADYAISRKFQWLPAIMKLDSTDGEYKFKSYINNLHPRNEKLYDLICKIFNYALPGLNYSLSRLSSKPIQRIELPKYGNWYEEEMYELIEQLEEEEDAWLEIEGQQQQEEEFDITEKIEALKPQYLKKFKPIWTKPHPINYEFDLRKNFEYLNVIVKMANIELTPENSKYAGGSWHVEGTINEDIVATILYYYDSRNITQSKLSFKCAYEDPFYEQDDKYGCKALFGLEDGDNMSKFIGDVECKQNRVLVFPNYFQHHVEPFELADKTQKGYRKILCMFVCDPFNEKIKNTSEIPPQQLDWWEDTPNSLFPKDLQRAIGKVGPEFIMDLESAKKVRVELMSERSVSERDSAGFDPYNRTFSLCEH